MRCGLCGVIRGLFVLAAKEDRFGEGEVLGYLMNKVATVERGGGGFSHAMEVWVTMCLGIKS